MSNLLVTQQKLQRNAAAITRLERELAKDPNSFVKSVVLESTIKIHEQLQADFYELADRESLDVCEYKLFGETNKEVSLRGLASSLLHFQTSISAIFNALKSGPKIRTRLGEDVASATGFGFGYAYTGSVGIVLTINRERMLIDVGTLAETITTFFRLAEVPTREEISEIKGKLGPAPMQAISKWVKAHVNDEIGADITWYHGKETKRLILEHSRLCTLQDAIEATPDEVHEDHDKRTVTGRLVGADVVTKQFRFVLDEGKTIKGLLGHEISEIGVYIPNTRYRARVEKISKIKYQGEKGKGAWKLLQLEEINSS